MTIGACGVNAVTFSFATRNADSDEATTIVTSTVENEILVLLNASPPRTITRLQQASTYVVLGGCYFDHRNASGSAQCATCGLNIGRLSSPMDVMMKSSSRVHRVRIVERPYDVLVTDPTPGKECTSSASYGLGPIPDEGTK